MSATPNINGEKIKGSITGLTSISVGTLSATTYQNLPTDVFVTGGTFSGTDILFSNNTGGTFNVSGFTTSSSFTGGTVTGGTIFTNGLTANTISATTYQNLPTDVFVTGGTYSNGITTLTNNTGGTFNVSGFFTGYTNVVNTLTTGVGLSADTTSGDVTIINTAPDQVVSLTQGTNITISGSYPNFTISATDVYVSGGTYDNNTGTATFTNTSGGTFNVSGFTTGGTSSSLTFNEVQRIAFLGV